MKCFYTIILSCFFGICCRAQSITLSNSTWTASISGADLITSAGLNYTNSELLSSTNHTSLSASALLTWQVQVHRTDVLWDNALSLSIRRTGNGSGLITLLSSPAVNTWVPITATDNLLLGSTGVGGRSNIPLQYRIQGLSVLVPAADYSTTIVFTISGL